MKVIAQAPIEGRPEGDHRPGDTFEAADGQALIDAGLAAPVVEPKLEAKSKAK